MVKQYIIVRKDLPMSGGKLSAQVSHASLAFLTHMLSEFIEGKKDEYGDYVVNNMKINAELWDDWLSPNSSFTKVVLAVKNENQLLKIVEKAKENRLIENEDFFCIKDEGRTELGNYKDESGRIFTCIGFKPYEEEKLKPVVGKLQVYKNKEA